MHRLIRVNYLRRAYSTKPARKERDPDRDLKEFERISNIQQKCKEKKPQKPPFVKNFLLGVVDTDLLVYPELEKEQWESVEKASTQALTLVNQPEVKENTNRNVFLKLGKEHLLGLQASQLLDGRELGVLESLRLSETFSELKLKNEVAQNEQFGIQTLLNFADDKLKRKYLEPLIRGEITSALCVLESFPFPKNLDHQKRTAILSNDLKYYTCSGTTQMVTNGSSADIYIVIAKDKGFGDKHGTYSAFVVERNFGGITSKQCTTGLNAEIADVTFENTQVPCENLIGKRGIGEDILKVVYPEYRLTIGTLCSRLQRDLIDKCVSHFINLPSDGPTKIYESEAIRSRIGEMVTSLYVTDSLTYMTAGLINDYDHQDCEIESIIVKIFASEQAFKSSTTASELIGPAAAMTNHWCHSLHQEALARILLPIVNDTLKLQMTLHGLRHAGIKLAEEVIKLRNPLYWPNVVIKKMWTDRHQVNDDPIFNLYLNQSFHPSLVPSARHLEYCILRLKFATEFLFSAHGQEVLNRHVDLRRLADVIIDIYAGIACVSRASRSYCIGLQHAHNEVLLAHAFCNAAAHRVKHNVLDIVGGHFKTNDVHYKNIAKDAFKFKKYFPVNPITRNF